RPSVLPTGAGGVLSAPVWLRGGSTLLFAQSEQVTLYAPSSRLVAQRVDGGAPRVLLSFPQVARTVDLLGSGKVVLDLLNRRAHLREVPRSPSAPGGWATGHWLTRGDA